jgi:hypothetical protein
MEEVYSSETLGDTIRHSLEGKAFRSPLWEPQIQSNVTKNTSAYEPGWTYYTEKSLSRAYTSTRPADLLTRLGLLVIFLSSLGTRWNRTSE